MSSSAGTVLLELRNVRKSYGGTDGPVVEILRGISLTVCSGEFIAVVGASGSGKSTLMHLLGCLDTPSSGQYLLCGKDVAQLDRDELAALRRETFGFVFQGYHLIATETARENVEVPALYAGMPSEQRQQRAQHLLLRLGVEEQQDRRPTQLSGGQQQRVAIARALMNGGRIILADEPTGALDSRSGEGVMGLLDELSKAGHTIILITHDRDVAAHARRIIEIRDGNILSDSGATFDSQDNLQISVRPIPKSLTKVKGNPSNFIDDVADACRAAWRVMWINRFRTALTLLGIVIGVASVIVILAIGLGTQKKVLEEMSAWGTNIMYVSARHSSARALGGRMTLEDVNTIRSVDNVRFVMPVVEGGVTLQRGNIDHHSVSEGVTSDFTDLLNWQLSSGVFIDEADEKQLAKVVVIGETVKKALFGDGSNPVGKQILVNKIPFLVVGVLSPKGALTGRSDADNRVVMPYSTAISRIYGTRFPAWITLSIHDMTRAKKTEEAIAEALMRSRQQKDFDIFNDAEAVRAQVETDNAMTIMLGFVAAISLVVGGIGIMNVMLMTVRERTREIGIRIATGARQRDILRQFLTEAILVSIMGGVAGIVIGLFIGAALVFMGIPIIFSLTSIVVAFSCAVVAGLVFGFMPARQAARLDPVIALSSE